jgi:hypothetical protein
LISRIVVVHWCCTTEKYTKKIVSMFRNLIEISSGPVALCWFRPCSSLYTPFWLTVICGASLYWLVPRFGMFEVLSVENTDENCEFSSFALVFGSPCKFPFSFRGAIPEFSHFLFLTKVKKFLVSRVLAYHVIYIFVIWWFTFFLDRFL